MTGLQYRFLVPYRDGVIPPPSSLSLEDRALWRTCKDAGFFAVAADGQDNWQTVLSDTGRAAMLEYEQQLEHQRKQRAEEEEKARSQRSYADQQTQKQFRHDWRIALFEALSGSILGAVADHFFDVVGHAARLWSSLFH